MGNTSIHWTQKTWNPTIGCKRVSSGCDSCYAFALHDKRHVAWKHGNYPTAPEQYHKPFSQVQLMPDRLEDPLHWKKPCMVFVNSMSDVFHEDIPDEFILKMFTVMRRASQHTFQILTKRPDRMYLFMQQLAWRTPTTEEREAGGLTGYGWQAYLAKEHAIPLPNVWLGVSVENQDAADSRISTLAETPAAVRFLSCEPLLGPIVFDPEWLWCEYYVPSYELQHWADSGARQVQLIHWCIVGGESGPRFRPMNPDWARSIRDQCDEHGVAFFYKQGSDIRSGQHRELDGRLWEEFPEQAVK